MTKLIRWQPVNDMLSLREAMDRLFEDSWVSNRAWGNLPGAWSEPTLDVYETPETVVVKAVVPGIKPDDVDITIKGNYLAISGESKEESETKDKNYLRRESRIGTFSRMVELPAGLQNDKADAKFEDGILTITFPKAEEVKPKKIQVKAVETNGQLKK
jgi:HSP20 family protein